MLLSFFLLIISPSLPILRRIPSTKSPSCPKSLRLFTEFLKHLVTSSQFSAHSAIALNFCLVVSLICLLFPKASGWDLQDQSVLIWPLWSGPADPVPGYELDAKVTKHPMGETCSGNREWHMKSSSIMFPTPPLVFTVNIKCLILLMFMLKWPKWQQMQQECNAAILYGPNVWGGRQRLRLSCGYFARTSPVLPEHLLTLGPVSLRKMLPYRGLMPRWSMFPSFCCGFSMISR